MDYKAIGKQIQRKRMEKQITVEELAKQAGIPIPYMVRMENRGLHLPQTRFGNLIAITEVLDCSIGDILCPPESDDE